MANEKLIDAEKLKLAIRDDPYVDGKAFARVKRHIEEAPTVEVVRCKDCMFCVYNSSNDTYKCNSMNGMYRRVNVDDFCSYGERRNEK